MQIEKQHGEGLALRLVDDCQEIGAASEQQDSYVGH